MAQVLQRTEQANDGEQQRGKTAKNKLAPLAQELCVCVYVCVCVGGGSDDAQ